DSCLSDHHRTRCSIGSMERCVSWNAHRVPVRVFRSCAKLSFLADDFGIDRVHVAAGRLLRAVAFLLIATSSVLAAFENPQKREEKKEDGRFTSALSAYHAVLTVKDERDDALAACGGLRSLTAARAVIGGERRQSRRCLRRLRHAPDQSSSSR